MTSKQQKQTKQTKQNKSFKYRFFTAGQSVRPRALMTTAIALPLALGLFCFPGSAMAAPPPPAATALPSGGTVVGGAATFDTSVTNKLTINQSTDRAIVNWNSFDIGSSGTVQINQPAATSLEVDRVTGSQNPTQILGNLNSNGQVAILNPNGVEFANGSQVNVNSLIASTGSIVDANVMNGASQIQLTNMNANASVTNAGTITVADAGLVALVGAQVANSGVINAKLGNVVLAGGNAATLDLNGDGLISIDASSTLASGDLVSNSGTINANGGIVQISASAAATTLDNIINMDGIITAQAATQSQTGQVLLTAAGPGKVSIGSNTANDTGGKIDVSNTQGGSGGIININGNQIALNNSANLNAAGNAGGGNILLQAFQHAAGNSTLPDDIAISSGAVLNTDATTSGYAGQIDAYTFGTVEANGQFSARGYATDYGAGTLIVYAPGGIQFDGTANFSGQTPGAADGTLSLVTNNISVGGLSTDTLTAATLESALNLEYVQLSAQNITFNQNVTSSNKDSLILTMQDNAAPLAPGQINLNADLAINNLLIASEGVEGINVGGSDIAGFDATNLTLDAPITFAQTPTNSSATVNVGSLFGNSGDAQQGYNLVAENGTLNLDGSSYNALHTDTSGVTVNGAQGGTTITFLNLDSANNKFNNLSANVVFDDYGSAQQGYDLTTANGGVLELAQSYYSSLDANKSGVTVEGSLAYVGRPGSSIGTLTLDTADNTFIDINAATVNDNKATAQAGYNLVAQNGTLNLGQILYPETLDADTAGVTVNGLTTPLGFSLLNTVKMDAQNTFNNILAVTVDDNVGTAQQGYNMVVPSGTLNLGGSYYNETLDAKTSDVTVNGANGGTNIATLTLDQPDNKFSGITANTVNDNQDTAQDGYDLVAQNGTLNLGQSNYNALHTDTSGVTVNGANGGTTITFLNLDSANNQFSKLNANVVFDDYGSAQQGYDLTTTNGVLELAQSSYGSLDANKSGVTVEGSLGYVGIPGSSIGTLTLDTADNTFIDINAATVNDNKATAAQGYSLTAVNGTLNLSAASYAETLDANTAGVTVNGAQGGTSLTGLMIDTNNDTFTGVAANTVTDNQGTATQGYHATAVGGTLNLAQGYYNETLDANTSGVTVNSTATGGTGLTALTLDTADNKFTGITAATVNDNKDTAQDGYNLVAQNGTLNLGQILYPETLDADTAGVTVNGLTTPLGFSLLSEVKMDAQNTFNNILALTVDDNVGTAQAGYDITAAGGTLNLGGNYYNETLDAKTSGVTVTGANGGTGIDTIALDQADNTFTGITANTVNDNVATAQQGYNLLAQNGTLNLGQLYYPEELNADTAGVTVNGSTANGFSLLTTVDMNAQNTFNNIVAFTVNDKVGTAQAGYDITAAGGTLNLGQGYYGETLDANKHSVSVNGTTGGTDIATISLDQADNSFSGITGDTINDNAATAQQGYNLASVNGTLNLAQGYYDETLNADTAGVTVNGSPSNGFSLFNAVDINSNSNTFNNIVGFTVNDNQGTAQAGYNITAAGGTLNLGQGYYGETLNADTYDVAVNGAAGGTGFTGISLNALNNSFAGVTASTVNYNVDAPGQLQAAYALFAPNGGTLNLGLSSYADSLDYTNHNVAVDSAVGGSLLNALTLDATATGMFSGVTATTVNDNFDDANGNLQTAYGLTANNGTLNLELASYNDSLDYTNNTVAVDSTAGGSLLNALTLDVANGSFSGITATTVNDTADTAQNGYDLVAQNGTLNLGQIVYPETLDADTAGVTVNGLTSPLGFSLLNTIKIDAQNTFNNILALTVDDNAGTAQSGYNVTAPGGTLNLAQAYYAETLNADTPNVTVNGSPSNGFSLFNGVDISAQNTFNNIVGFTVNDNQGTAQQGYNMTAAGGTLNLGQTLYPETLDADTYGVTVNGVTTPLPFSLLNTVKIDAQNNTFNNILALTVDDNVGTAQQGYNITATGGTLNLAQSSYAETLDAKTSDVTVNGAAGNTALDGLTLDVADNNFNSITTPVINVNAVGASQQAINLVNTGGTVNFGFYNSPETITFDRDITLNGDTAPSQNPANVGTTFDTFNLNTTLGQINNILGETVNINAGTATRGVDITAEGGTANLANVVYVPEALTVPYDMTINGAPTFSLFSTVDNSVGATLNRIYELTSQNASSQGLTLVISNPNGVLPRGQTVGSVESILSALAPAGPGSPDNIRLCTAQSASAAGSCASEALADGRTVVVFDITTNKLSLLSENATNQVIETKQVTPEELEQIIQGQESI